MRSKGVLRAGGAELDWRRSCCCEIRNLSSICRATCSTEGDTSQSEALTRRSRRKLLLSRQQQALYMLSSSTARTTQSRTPEIASMSELREGGVSPEVKAIAEA